MTYRSSNKKRVGDRDILRRGLLTIRNRGPKTEWSGRLSMENEPIIGVKGERNDRNLPTLFD